MSTISQDRARIIARSLTKKKKDLVDKAEKALSEAIAEEYKKSIPKDVLAFQERYPKYVRTAGSVYLHGHGFSSDYRSMAGDWPNTSSNTAQLTLNAAQGARIQKLEAKRDALSKEYDQLFKEIENALLSLKTFKRIREQFPEAKEFLPNDSGVSTQLIVNLDDIRKKLIE